MLTLVVFFFLVGLSIGITLRFGRFFRTKEVNQHLVSLFNRYFPAKEGKESFILFFSKVSHDRSSDTMLLKSKLTIKLLIKKQGPSQTVNPVCYLYQIFLIYTFNHILLCLKYKPQAIR